MGRNTYFPVVKFLEKKQKIIAPLLPEEKFKNLKFLPNQTLAFKK